MLRTCLVVNRNFSLIIHLFVVSPIEVQAEHNVDVFGCHYKGALRIQDNVALFIYLDEVEANVAVFHRQVCVFELAPGRWDWSLNLQEHLALTLVAKCAWSDRFTVQFVPWELRVRAAILLSTV